MNIQESLEEKSMQLKWTAFRLMSDVKQQLNRRPITMIGVVCLVRAIEKETELVGGGGWGVSPPSPPLATGAQSSLACMLLQAWPKQSMLSTLFISK